MKVSNWCQIKVRQKLLLHLLHLVEVADRSARKHWQL